MSSVASQSDSSKVARLNVYDKIPNRVKANVDLQARVSQIHGAGRGLFVKQAVKAGDLIFSIKHPVLSIVGDGQEMLTTCDNCFASASHPTVDREIPQFKYCSNCHVFYYCSKECWLAAWEHHHKFECKELAQPKDATLPRTSPEYLSPIKEKHFVALASFRCLLRLLCLKEKGQITDQLWAEFLSLENDKVNKIKKTGTLFKLREWVSLLAAKPVMARMTTVPTHEAMFLIYAIMNNQLNINLPILERNKTSNPDVGAQVHLGKVLDPFAALINHSCYPNAWIVNESNTLCVRAISNIPANSELTINYISSLRADRMTRNTTLRRIYTFACTCFLCGPDRKRLEPKPKQKRDLNDILEPEVMQQMIKIDAKMYLKHVEHAIDQLKVSGRYPHCWPTHELHNILYSGRFFAEEHADALKLWLKIHFVIQPAQLPRFSPDQTIKSLRVLIALLSDEDVCKALKTDNSFPPELVDVLPRIVYHLRGKLVRQTENCWGADSAVAKFERKLYEEHFGALEKDLMALKESYYIPVTENEEAKKQFNGDMVKLLMWVGIEVAGWDGVDGCGRFVFD